MDTRIHPALMSFLHPARTAEPPADAASARLRNVAPVGAEDNQQQKTQQADTASRDDGSTMHVLLVSPSSLFSTNVADVLHRIDSDFHLTHATQLSRTALRSSEGAALALVDIDAFPAEAESLIREISARSPRAPVVAMSERRERGSIDRALDAGAVGYLPKSYTATLIEGVLRLIIGGEGYRPQDIQPAPPKRGRPRTEDRQTAVSDNVAGLTQREKEVLAQLAKGHTNLEIAKQLGIREPTVKLHLHKVYEKLKVRNRAEAALSGARVAVIQQAQIEEAERGGLNLSWLQPEMSHRRMRAGQWIFRAGDVGSELFYVQRGCVKLPEIGVTIDQGGVFGEIGIFTPERKRTCSAQCETEVDVFSLSSSQVRRVFFANPQFAFFITTLVATRLMADRQRG
jgi:two-component system nitrate/nitrite response regulator NarL